MENCKCLQIGHGKPGMNYDTGGTIISATVKENILGETF